MQSKDRYEAQKDSTRISYCFKRFDGGSGKHDYLCSYCSQYKNCSVRKLPYKVFERRMSRFCEYWNGVYRNYVDRNDTGRSKHGTKSK